MKIVFATSLDNIYVEKAYTFLERLIENKNVIYLRNPINKAIAEKYDVGFSFLYQHKVPKSELDWYTWYNWHPGPLPNYRGRNVVYHAMMNRAEKFGGTLHYMDENFDTGDIIEVERFPILNSYTAGDVIDKTYDCLLNLFYKYVPKILDGQKPHGFKQGTGNYYKPQKIDEQVRISFEQEFSIRALTVHPKFHAKVKVGGKLYKIVPEEN